jgi:hypothetical protein
MLDRSARRALTIGACGALALTLWIAASCKPESEGREEQHENELPNPPSESAVLLAYLGTEATWREAKESEEKGHALRDKLALVGVIPCEGVEKVLAKHIAFSLEDEVKRPVIPIEEEHPAFAALVRMGEKSVPELVHLLRTVDPATDSLEDIFEADKRRRSRVLAIFALVEIYKARGTGKRLARERLELEVEKSQGKEKELLQKALEHFALN